MMGAIIFGAGVVTGAFATIALLCVLVRREKRKVDAEIVEMWSSKSGLTREVDEPIPTFISRATDAAAKRELEQEWGIPRDDDESWEVYTQRVARAKCERRVVVGMPVVIGPRGQA